MDREFTDFKEKLLDRTDIVSLISKYVKLERKGRNLWACCPFHSEDTPSFAVNESKRMFHCFGCKESGDAISFLMKIEHIEFMEAVRRLADGAGMEVPRFSGSREHTVDKGKRERLYNLMRDAARHYHDNLSSPRAKVFRDYLEERKIPSGMITRFGLGAALDFNEMLEFLESKGYTHEEMKAAGIADTRNDRHYDVFGKRLMYPIIDGMGNVVAFGGRTLEKDVHFAKYRNSTQTDIFDKSKIIYGANLLKKRASKGQIDYIIMTEGYMDVIALHKAGFDTAVASMGTALTARQAKQLISYSKLVYISYDGDTAGQKATLRGLDILKECGLTVKVVRLPDGLDPDDVIKRDGKEGYQKLLDEAIPLTAYKIEVLKAKYDLSDPDQKAKFAIEAAAVVRALPNPVEQEQYFEYVESVTGFSVSVLRRQAAYSEPDSPPPAVEKREEKVEYDDNLKFFLSSIFQGRDYVDFDKNLTGIMPDELSKKLYALCREHESGLTLFIVDELSDEERECVDKILEYTYLPGDGRERFVDVEKSLYRRLLNSELDYLKTLPEKDESVRVRMQQIMYEIAKYPQNRS
ncbi:MAG: DNA primase [Clostridiales bacterium]|nr:DNA primase [Clostridiales bacterium]